MFLDKKSPKTLIIKLGTQVVTDSELNFDEPRLKGIVKECAELHKQGSSLVIVSSGAVGLGKGELKLSPDLTLVEKQACAAVGQASLMEKYRSLFAHYGITVAQVLLTSSDFATHERYTKISDTLRALLSHRVIPIINENDTVSTVELKEFDSQGKSFGDNDKLAALVSSHVSADLLVLFTNVDGLFTDNPLTNKAAEKIAEITSFEALAALRIEGSSLHGRGGMQSKIEAAWCASLSGVPVVIASGIEPYPLSRLFNSDKMPGTFIHPKQPLKEKKRWIRFGAGFAGIITINKCAVEVLERDHASLLPVGIVTVEGEFLKGQIVTICDEDGGELGRGITRIDAADLKKVIGLKSAEIKVLNFYDAATFPTEAVHRDYMVLLRDYD
jgi:glutamate 5-kinase